MPRMDHKDDASTLLARRCAYYLKHPPPTEWDGVERLVQKTWQEGQAEQLGCGDSETSSEECSHERGSAIGSFESARSTGDSLRLGGAGFDPHEQPVLCFCGYDRMDAPASWRDLFFGQTALRPEEWGPSKERRMV